jgi:hypothetical protein
MFLACHRFSLHCFFASPALMARRRLNSSLVPQVQVPVFSDSQSQAMWSSVVDKPRTSHQTSPGRMGWDTIDMHMGQSSFYLRLRLLPFLLRLEPLRAGRALRPRDCKWWLVPARQLRHEGGATGESTDAPAGGPGHCSLARASNHCSALAMRLCGGIHHKSRRTM